MTQLMFRVYRRGSRAPRDFIGKVEAGTPAEALQKVLAQPANERLRRLEVILEAVPVHSRKPGK